MPKLKVGDVLPQQIDKKVKFAHLESVLHNPKPSFYPAFSNQCCSYKVIVVTKDYYLTQLFPDTSVFVLKISDVDSFIH